MKKAVKLIAIAVLALGAALAGEQNANAQLSNLWKKITGSSSSTTTTETTVSAAQTSGSETGAALKALYTQYKADKKLDMSNISNIANVAKLASGVNGLKENIKDKTYDKDFTKGLIGGSKNLVNESNSTSILSSLKNMADLDFSSITSSANSKVSEAANKASEAVSKTATKASEAASKASAAATKAAEVTESVTSLLSLFK